MSRAIRKARDFTADFENVFGWYVEKAGVEVAWRFQMALDKTLAQLSIRPDLGRPEGLADLWRGGGVARQSKIAADILLPRALPPRQISRHAPRSYFGDGF